MLVYVEQQLPILPLLAVLCSTWGNVHPTQALACLIPSCSISISDLLFFCIEPWVLHELPQCSLLDPATVHHCPDELPLFGFQQGWAAGPMIVFIPSFRCVLFFNSVCTSRSSACLMFFVDGSYHHLAIVFPDILLVKNRRNFARKSWSKAVVGCFIQLFWWLNVVGKQNTT